MESPRDVGRRVAKRQRLGNPSIPAILLAEPRREIAAKRRLIGDRSLRVIDDRFDGVRIQPHLRSRREIDSVNRHDRRLPNLKPAHVDAANLRRASVSLDGGESDDDRQRVQDLMQSDHRVSIQKAG